MALCRLELCEQVEPAMGHDETLIIGIGLTDRLSALPSPPLHPGSIVSSVGALGGFSIPSAVACVEQATRPRRLQEISSFDDASCAVILDWRMDGASGLPSGSASFEFGGVIYAYFRRA